MIDSEYFAHMRSPWCWQDYVDIISEQDTYTYITYESDPKIIQYGYCAVALGDFYLKMIGDINGETVYYY